MFSLRHLIVGIALAPIACGSSPSDPVERGPGIVSFGGRVTSSADGAPVWGAHVSVYHSREGGDRVTLGFSAQEGVYVTRWAECDADTFYVQATCEGYLDSGRIAVAVDCPGSSSHTVDFVLDPVPPEASGR